MFNPSHIASVAPTANDDYSEGFRQGVFWWDDTAGRWYLCESPAEGAAVWKNISGGAITSWDDWTPSYSWTGNTPTGITTVARFIVLGKICYFTLQVSGTNAAGASITDMTATLPAYAAIVVNNSLVVIDTVDYPDGRWEKGNIAVIDSVADPARLGHKTFNSIGASEAFTLYYAGHYETE